MEFKRLFWLGCGTVALVLLILMLMPKSPNCNKLKWTPGRRLFNLNKIASDDYRALAMSVNNYIKYPADDTYLLLELESVERPQNHTHELSSNLTLEHDCARIRFQVDTEYGLHYLNWIYVDIYEAGEYKMLCKGRVGFNWPVDKRFKCTDEYSFRCDGPNKFFAVVVFVDLEFEVNGDITLHKEGQFEFEPKQVCNPSMFH